MEGRLNMKARSIFIIGFVLFSFMVSFMILTEPLVVCDPYIGPPLTGVTLEGAHIVSEGAYFRFGIFNNNSFSISVRVGADISSVPPESGIDYDVIAPQISTPYEKVTYQFDFGSNDAELTVDYTVLVLNSSFVQIFDLVVPIIIVIAFVIIATVAIVILRRYMHARARSNVSMVSNYQKRH
jgi:hypothetical protein